MILCIKTDNPIAELYLYDGQTIVATKTWEAHRSLARDLLRECHNLLGSVDGTFATLSGIVVFRGPGSFTGLRIGCTVANTIAYSEHIPIIGEEGDDWVQSGMSRIQRGENHHVVMPAYGAEPRISIAI